MKRLLVALAAIFLWPNLAAAQTTIYNVPLTSSNNGNAGYSFRQEVTTTGNSLGQVQLSISNTSGTLQLDHVGYCISTGASGNCTATPVEVTFPASCGTNCVGGASGHGFTTSATNVTALSDWITFATAGTDVIVIMDITAATTGDISFLGGQPATSVLYYKVGGTYNVQTPGGLTTLANQANGIILIQTRTGAGGPTAHLRLLKGVGP